MADIGGIIGSTVQGAGAGAAAGPWGALAGGVVGLAGGLFNSAAAEEDEKKRQEILKKAAEQLGVSQAQAQQMFNQYYANNSSVGRESDVSTYRSLVDNYDPNEFVYDYEDFDNNYDVNDYYAANRDAIIEKTANQVQAGAAGSGIGRGTGAANQIATGVANKNEELYKDAQNAMNQDRTFNYNLWSGQITQGQNRLNQLKSAYDTNLNQYGTLAQDYQDWQAQKVQQQMDLNANNTANNLQLTLASI